MSTPVRDLFARLGYLSAYMQKNGQPLSVITGNPLDDPAAFSAHHGLNDPEKIAEAEKEWIGSEAPAVLVLWRGQKRGAPIGFWWTSDRDDALAHARSRGGREYEILTVEVPTEWAKPFLQFEGAGAGHRAHWYKVPPERLSEHTMALTGEVRIGFPTILAKPVGDEP